MNIANVNYAGRKFGDITALHKVEGKKYIWSFLCVCGKLLNRNIYGVLRGGQKPRCTHVPSVRRKHLDTYNTWLGMISRCHRATSAAYYAYGGRGIHVCPEWQTYPKGFLRFLSDMGDKPEGLTIERINVNEGYSKTNCTWASVADQNRNKQYHRIVTYNGVTQPLFKWVSDLGLNYYTVHSRLNKGWPMDEVLGFKPHSIRRKGDRRFIRHEQEIMSVLDPHKEYTRADVASITGKDRETVRTALGRLVNSDSLLVWLSGNTYIYKVKR